MSSLLISIRKKSLKVFKEIFFSYLTLIHMYLSMESLIAVFSSLNCISLYGIKNQRLYFDYNIVCWDQNHLNWTLSLSFPILFFWIICLPLALFVKLLINIDLIHNKDKDFYEKYGIIYDSFNNSCLYWGFLTYFNKIAGSTIVTFLARTTEGFNGLMFILALIFMYIRQTTEKPFICKNYIIFN